MKPKSKTQVQRIGVDEIRTRMKDLVFVDARSETALSHNPHQVQGAIHVPVKELEKGSKRLPRNRTLVTYCT